EIRFIHYLDENVALEDVKAGNLDTYYFRIPLEVASDIKSNQNVKTYDRISQSFELLINPAPSRKDTSTINPFEFREVRYAMNYLIDREFISNEIMKGYARPVIDPLGYDSPDYLNVIDTVESFGFRYNPGLAEKMIAHALVAEGAVKQNGKWTFKGSPIIIKLFIRSDDQQRKSLGDLIASELEKIGFVVQKDYGDLNKANGIIFGSDPQDFQWHIYTSATGSSLFSKYNEAAISSMYAPWLGTMPGFQNPSFWNYQNKSLDEVTKRLVYSNFTSENERNSLLQNATKAGIQESVRVLLVKVIEPFVASSTLKGLVNDFGAGITSKYSLVNARSTKDNSSLDIGVKQIYQSAWNNVGGFTDTYSQYILSAISDAPIFTNPYTGDILPMRYQWTNVSTVGPLDKLKVAPDALLWNPITQQWKNVGDNGTTAKSKVTYKILYSNWHNGIPMDKSDLLYSQYFLFEWGTNSGQNDRTIDPQYLAAASAGIPYEKGIKFLANDEIQYFSDFWHYDKNQIAGFAASSWPAQPWEITAATERLVTGGKLAYSKGEATAKNIDWLSLIIPQHANLIKTELQKMKDESFVPPALKGFVTVDEAKKRYDASIKWITNHNHAVISNGPFYLDSYNPSGRIITIKAFRDPSYPFEQGHWSYFENPKLADIGKVEAPQFIKRGQPTKIQISIKVNGQPTNDALVNYFVSDRDGRLVVHGQVQPTNNTGNNPSGTYEINIQGNETSKLSVGPNTLKIFATSKEAYRPAVATNILLAIPGAVTGGSSNSR
ncbi:MAG TPA: ABC transporter substrate-binding protein, partial [Nitrososphaeraceae archaeon]|nr:ABC transporter substrate-binding protein [Nitrososphaeraceae archaeon]